MKNNFFNIVIPTKNRANTLPFTIKTIMNQNYGDYKIIIADNNSTDNTESIIKKMNNNKIIYTKSKIDLPMNENWERGLNLVDEGYVTVLGDDDGLFPNALYELNKFLKNCDTEIVSWFPNCYHWLNFDGEKKNEVEIYINNKKDKFSRYNSKSILKKVLDMSILYLDSPMIYNSFVNINLINNIKLKKKNNIFFSNGIPDVYSGLILLLNSKSYYKANFPVGLAGISKNSNGALLSKKDKTIDDIKKNMELFNIKRVPPIPSYYLCILEPFNEICEDFNEAKKYLINYHRLKIRVETEISNEPNENKKFYKEKLKLFIIDIKKKYNFFQKLKIFYNLFEICFYKTFDRIIFKLDDNINNVDDASKEILKNYYFFSNNISKKIKKLDKNLYLTNLIKKVGIYNFCLTVVKLKKIIS